MSEEIEQEEYHIATGKLTETEYQALREIVIAHGSTVSAEVRIAVQHYLRLAMPDMSLAFPDNRQHIGTTDDNGVENA